jgi:hypothetical protein
VGASDKVGAALGGGAAVGVPVGTLSVGEGSAVEVGGVEAVAARTAGETPGMSAATKGGGVVEVCPPEGGLPVSPCSCGPGMSSTPLVPRVSSASRPITM